MSLLRFEKQTNVYDKADNILGQIENDDPCCFPTFRTAEDAQITADELREIADYLENL